MNASQCANGARDTKLQTAGHSVTTVTTLKPRYTLTCTLTTVVSRKTTHRTYCVSFLPQTSFSSSFSFFGGTSAGGRTNQSQLRSPRMSLIGQISLFCLYFLVSAMSTGRLALAATSQNVSKHSLHTLVILVSIVSGSEEQPITEQHLNSIIY